MHSMGLRNQNEILSRRVKKSEVIIITIYHQGPTLEPFGMGDTLKKHFQWQFSRAIAENLNSYHIQYNPNNHNKY